MFILYQEGYNPSLNFRRVLWPDRPETLQQEWRSDRVGKTPYWVDVPCYIPSEEEIENGTLDRKY